MRAQPFPLQPPAAQPQLTGPISPHDSAQLSNKARLFASVQEREVSLSLLMLGAFASSKAIDEQRRKREEVTERPLPGLVQKPCIPDLFLPVQSYLEPVAPQTQIYAHMPVFMFMWRPEVKVKCLVNWVLRQGFSEELEFTSWVSHTGQQAPGVFLS